MSKYNNYSSKTVSVTTSATELAAQNTNRSVLMLFNQGSSDIKFYFDSHTAAYFTLESGKGMYFPCVPLNQVNAVTDSGTATVTVMEA